MKRRSPAAALCIAALVALGPASVAFAQDGLTVFDWAGYEDPAFFPSYMEKNGTAPTFAFFGDEEEAFQKLRSGFTADLAHPCSQSVVKWREAGLLKPIDTSRLPAWKDLIPEIRDMAGFEADGQAWIVPFDWGNTALIYRTDLVPVEDTKSLQIFADPKYAGKVSLPDNVDDAYALGALAVGVLDWTTMTDAQFEAASAFLRAVAANVRMYWTDNTELSQAMASSEVVLAWGWNETPVTLAAEGYPVAMQKDTAEGISTWVCGYTLLANGPGSEDKAYDFLNAVMDPRSGTFLLTDWGYGHANGVTMSAADPAVVAERGYGDFETFRDKTLFAAPLPQPLRERMIQEFERIKAGF
jgi:spermidine/putrescine transport system substrate-binding protein